MCRKEVSRSLSKKDASLISEVRIARGSYFKALAVRPVSPVLGIDPPADVFLGGCVRRWCAWGGLQGSGRSEDRTPQSVSSPSPHLTLEKRNHSRYSGNFMWQFKLHVLIARLLEPVAWGHSNTVA